MAAACEAAELPALARVAGIADERHSAQAGDGPVSASHALADQLERHHADAGQVAPRARQAFDEPRRDRIAAEREHDRSWVPLRRML